MTMAKKREEEVPSSCRTLVTREWDRGGPGPSRWIARRHLGIQPHTSIHHNGKLLAVTGDGEGEGPNLKSAFQRSLARPNLGHPHFLALPSRTGGSTEDVYQETTRMPTTSSPGSTRQRPAVHESTVKQLNPTTDEETAIGAAREKLATPFTEAAQSTIVKVKVPAGAPG
ncbi:hypothetical protein BGW80DRAFT_1446216 [Lactifluus volemus]|nr:hypothetical protein BGW80DRAFT_1446216 [Lactifluus volemus]